jgi:hypothetical protein
VSGRKVKGNVDLGPRGDAETGDSQRQQRHAGIIKQQDGAAITG